MTRKPIPELAALATRLAERLGKEASEKGSGNFQGSVHRDLPDDLRREIIDLRSQLMERGVYDPVLVRFDTATVPQASNGEIADRLREVGRSLTGDAPTQD